MPNEASELVEVSRSGELLLAVGDQSTAGEWIRMELPEGDVPVRAV
jgi:hypothetical protein